MDNAEVKEAMGTWLGELAPWNVFSTWTFSHLVTSVGAMYSAKRHLRTLEERAEIPVHAFVTAERGGSGGLIHIHALVGNVGALKPRCGERLGRKGWGRSCCMEHSWPKGIARVYDYNPKLGAKHYLSKYITKDLAEWELIGFPAQPQKVLDFRAKESG